MIYIISGTNRPQSRTLEVSKIILKLYEEIGAPVELMDLAKVPMHEVSGSHYGKELPGELKVAVDKVMASEGLVIVCPEYNGSMPGVLKYFIDHWPYPDTFEARPVSFVGLGGRFGGLRPVEHLQQIFGYRNAFVFPERVFFANIWTTLKDGKLNDPMAMDLLKKQTLGFKKFVRALENEHLDANSVLRNRPPKTK
jgi:chromate reductase